LGYNNSIFTGVIGNDSAVGRPAGMTDLALYRRIVQQCFPALEVSNIQFVGGGTFRVFEVNAELIFRFPHILATCRLRPDAQFEQRMAFHSRRVLFHELLYGIEYDAPECTDHALKRLRRAMADQEPIGGWLAASMSQTRRQEGFPA